MPIKEIIEKLKTHQAFRAFNDVILMLAFGLAFVVIYIIALLIFGDYGGLFAPGTFISGLAVFPMSAGIFAFATVCLNLSFPDLYTILYRRKTLLSKDVHWEEIRIALWVYSLYIVVPCLIALALL